MHRVQAPEGSSEIKEMAESGSSYRRGLRVLFYFGLNRKLAKCDCVSESFRVVKHQLTCYADSPD